MKTGPRYKKARRLGASVFEKTQSQKFALSQNRKANPTRRPPVSEFGRQMLEKQKAKVTYGLNERQFKNLVKRSVAEKGTDSKVLLYQALETRADNVVFRIGLANSRQMSRQMVSHGHILVNGKKITVPSYALSVGDVIRVREGSTKSPLFKDITEKIKKASVGNWITFDANKVEWKLVNLPVYNPIETAFDIGAILEFYTR